MIVMIMPCKVSVHLSDLQDKQVCWRSIFAHPHIGCLLSCVTSLLLLLAQSLGTRPEGMCVLQIQPGQGGAAGGAVAEADDDGESI